MPAAATSSATACRVRSSSSLARPSDYLAACLAGLGIIQIPEVGVLAQIAAGELVELLPELCPAPMPVSLLYANRRHLPRRARVFMDWVTEMLRPHVLESELGHRP